MKRILLFATSVLCAVSAFGQGSINFNNRVLSTPPSVTGPQQDIYAPVYAPQAGNPAQEVHGQSAAGVPVGATVYTGGLLSGTGFTAELWGGSSANDLQICTQLGTPSGLARTTFRTGATTMGSVVIASANAAVNPAVPSDASARGTFELRAYNNNGGQITSWAAALAGQLASPSDVNHALGSSGPFVIPFQLGGTPAGAPPVTPPNLVGLTSFNIHTVPEPSSIALGLIGLGSLMFLRRRK